MKKLLKLFCLTLSILLLLTGCGTDIEKENMKSKPIDAKNIKIGVIYIDDATKGNSLSHKNGLLKAKEILGLKDNNFIEITNVQPNDECTEKLNELIGDGCNIIFATNPLFDSFVSEIVDSNKDVFFSVYKGLGNNKKNYDNYYGKFYELNFFEGITAGLKTVSKKIGYILPDYSWQSIADCNGYALGVRNVNPDATVVVKSLDGKTDALTEKNCANALIKSGCDILVSPTETDVVYEVAKQNNVYTTGVNYSNNDETMLINSKTNWDKYYIEIIKSAIKGTLEPSEYFYGYKNKLFDITYMAKNNDANAEKYITEIQDNIKNNNYEIFSGIITDNNGKNRIEKDCKLKPSEIKDMDWFVKGIELK